MRVITDAPRAENVYANERKPVLRVMHNNVREYAEGKKCALDLATLVTV